MDWGSLVGAISDTGIAIGSGVYDYMAEKRQASREDTAYQRAVADAQKAGINPASLFSGSGSAASSSATSSSDNWSQAAAQAAVLASNLAVNRAQIENVEADTSLKGAQEEKVEAETSTIAPESEVRIEQAKANAEKLRAESDSLYGQLSAVIAEAGLREFDASKRLAFLKLVGLDDETTSEIISLIESGDYVAAGIVFSLAISSGDARSNPSDVTKGDNALTLTDNQVKAVNELFDMADDVAEAVGLEIKDMYKPDPVTGKRSAGRRRGLPY